MPQLSPTLTNAITSRAWRLDNLYKIKDKSGKVVTFQRNQAQRQLWRDMHTRNIVLKARQLGFSTFIQLYMLDACLFAPNTDAGVIAQTRDDAQRMFEKIHFAYDGLPGWLKSLVGATQSNVSRLTFSNNSTISVSTSHRGGTLRLLHVSEFGKVSAEAPHKAREIITGAIETVPTDGAVFVESTAEGASGRFFDMCQAAQASADAKGALNPLQFRLHFVPWHVNPQYRLDEPAFRPPAELGEYFAKLPTTLDRDQQAWYTSKWRQLGPDDMFREYPSTPDEPFKVSIEGAYFARQMSDARRQGRLGTVPHDPNRPVYTAWDLGVDDATAIWFWQSDGVRVRMLEYVEDSGEGLAHYAKLLRRRRDERGYEYGTHYGPHDLAVKEWGSDAKPRIEIAADLGIQFRIVPRVQDKADAIEAARALLPMCYFDQAGCEAGIRALDSYRKEWDPRAGTWRAKPHHDWSSHCADALMTLALGREPERIEELDDPYRKRRQRRSAWAA